MPGTQSKCPKCGAAYPSGYQMCVRCGTRLPGYTPGPGESAPGNAVQGFRRGQVVASRYTVVDVIGRGGMGCIYKVRDNTLDEDVALKTLLPKFANDQHVVDRFFNEARIARQLSHPHIIRVHDIGMAGSVIYISMEYIPGRSLRGWLDSLGSGKRMPIAYALRVMVQLSAALEYAHRFTVHRDLKPENVMINREGQVKLMDFGISKLKSSAQLTSAQMVMGTPKYMSPEQLKDSSRVDARSDIYSLGAMLYELLTGDPPTGLAKRPSQVRGDVPPQLDDLVVKCLEMDPKDRHQSAAEVRHELQRLLELVEKQTGIEIPDVEAALPAPPPTARTPVFKRLAGIAVVALVLFVAAAGIWRLEQIAPAETAPPDEPGLETPVATEDAFQNAFDDLRARVERAREAAAAAAGETAAPRYGQAAAKLLEDAEALAAERDPRAFEVAWYALQCCLGPLICPEDMQFVPPGETMVETGGEPVRVAGFFIETCEVTNEQFREFKMRKNWLSPAYLSGQFDAEYLPYPVTEVTFYDALAYAAWADPAPWGRRTLPTEAQWARAAYGDARPPELEPRSTPRVEEKPEPDDEAEGDEEEDEEPVEYAGVAPVAVFESDRSTYACWDMAGNVMEWTRSVFTAPYDRRSAETGIGDVWFGASLAVRGGTFEQERVSLDLRRPMAFDAAGPALGFRCVLPFPPDNAAVDAALDRLGF